MLIACYFTAVRGYRRPVYNPAPFAASMAPSFRAIAESIQRQSKSKWLWHICHLADRLEVSAEELNEFILRIQNGGSGVRKDGTWATNPAPYDRKIDLVKNEDNGLNLHLVDSGCTYLDGCQFNEPSPAIVDASSRYVRLGNIRSMSKSITLKEQREIAKFVLGTHQTLTKHYPKISERRRRTWRQWVEGESGGDEFHKLDLPVIASYFCAVWDAPIPRGTAPNEISPTVLDLVKGEIVELLVRMFVIPAARLDIIMVRRSRRGAQIDVSDEIVLADSSRKRKRLTPEQVSSPEDDDDNAEDEGDSVLHLFNLRAMKELVRKGQLKEVGRREILLLAAHSGRSRHSANCQIVNLGGLSYSIEECGAISEIPKSDMSKKKGNFNKLRAWMNHSLPFEYMRIGDDENLLEFARNMERWNEGVRLQVEIMNGNNLTTKSAAIMRHILYSNPKIGWAAFILLLNQFFVLIAGRPAKEDEFPSLLTVRSNIARLDRFDEYELKKNIDKFTQTLSPRGNRVYFGGGGDGTCHGKADKREVCVIAVANNNFHPKNPYMIDPSVIVTTASSPVGSDSNANSEHYLESIERVVSKKSLASMVSFTLDNCTTAQKDGRLTLSGAQERAKHGHANTTFAHGVQIEGTIIRDPFHIFQLCIKHFSETACGIRDKANANEDIFHRQVSDISK